MNQSEVFTEINGPVARILLNRPDFHNALNYKMIVRLISIMDELGNNDKIRIITLTGLGNSFCSGADLRWMLDARKLSGEDNYEECLKLAQCFFAIYSCPKITMALIHGRAYGGAIGLVAASDLAYASGSSEFAFSEVKLGLIPATIAPYVLRKTGYKASEYLLSGERFSSTEAARMSLVDAVISDDDFDTRIHKTLVDLANAAPLAQKKIKRQIQAFAGPVIDQTLVQNSASVIAEVRISIEAREGMNAFFEKRIPAWQNE